MSAFIIPMAGMSSRFFRAGYDKPKFKLMIGQETMFSWSVRSFEKYFKTDDFLFILRGTQKDVDFLLDEISKLGIKSYRLCVLDKITSGQAETVLNGINEFKFFVCNQDIYIFNIDSQRINFTKQFQADKVDGYLELFQGKGEHWSFAQLTSDNKVIRTAEKKRISDFCSDGMYHFSDSELFKEAYQDMIENNRIEHGETYIAPMYNYLVEKGYDIRGYVVESDLISFCGTPDEYCTLLKQL